MVIDGIPVTDEERAKAELYFMDQQVAANVCFHNRHSLTFPLQDHNLSQLINKLKMKFKKFKTMKVTCKICEY